MGDHSPVYKVKPKSGCGRTRVLHRNLLLPCDALELDIPHKELVPRSRRKTAEQPSFSVSEDESQSSGQEDEPSESIENDGTVEDTKGLFAETESIEVSGEYDGSEQSEEEDVAEQNMPTRPQHERRPPQVLTYNFLGNPQYQCVEPVVRSTFVNSIQAPWLAPTAAAVHLGAPFYYWVWPVFSQPPCY